MNGLGTIHTHTAFVRITHRSSFTWASADGVDYHREATKPQYADIHPAMKGGVRWNVDQ